MRSRSLVLYLGLAVILTGCTKSLPQICSASRCHGTYEATAPFSEPDERPPVRRPGYKSDLRVHFIPVGPGLCTLIECPGTSGDSVLYDCGTANDLLLPGRSTYKGVREYIRGILGARPGRLNIVVSHADFDHYSLIEYVTEWMQRDRFGTVLIPEFGDAKLPLQASANRAYTYLKNRAGLKNLIGPQKRKAWGVAGAPHKLRGFCGKASTHVLASDVGEDANSRSLVLHMQHGEFEGIFAGDAHGTYALSTEQLALGNLRKIKGATKRVTLMQASHHGSSTHGSNGLLWVRGTAPTITVFSRGQLYNHPTCEASCRYYNAAVATDSERDFECGRLKRKNWPGNRITRKNVEMDRALYDTHMDGYVRVTTGGTQVTVQCADDPDHYEACGIDHRTVASLAAESVVNACNDGWRPDLAAPERGWDPPPEPDEAAEPQAEPGAQQPEDGGSNKGADADVTTKSSEAAAPGAS